MKYGTETLGRIEAVLNRITQQVGEDGIDLLLAGALTITKTIHLINLDAAPFTPEGWQVVEHHKGGQWKYDPAGITLYLSEQQTGDKWMLGDVLRTELVGKSVFNANLLDYLLANPHLIPEGWKNKAVFFWGTIYRGARGYLYVRYLRWNGTLWSWYALGLGYRWSAYGPAALRASA